MQALEAAGTAEESDDLGLLSGDEEDVEDDGKAGPGGGTGIDSQNVRP